MIPYSYSVIKRTPNLVFSCRTEYSCSVIKPIPLKCCSITIVCGCFSWWLCVVLDKPKLSDWFQVCVFSLILLFSHLNSFTFFVAFVVYCITGMQVINLFSWIVFYIMQSEENNEQLAYWLSSTSTLLFLLQRSLKDGSSQKPPPATTLFGRMAQVWTLIFFSCALGPF